MEILSQLEKGDIGVDEAVRRLGDRPVAERTRSETRVDGWVEGWWLVPFFLGLAFTALGGWLGALGGGWWWAAIPALVLGIPLMTLAAVSRGSPVVYIRVVDRHPRRRHRILIGLPVPLRLVAGIVRVARPWIPGLNATALDEFLVALDGSLSRDRPLVVEVSRGDEGERVDVSFG